MAKISLVLLFLLLSLSSFFIFSLYPSPLSPSFTTHSSSPLLQSPYTNFTFVIKVLTFDRLTSLSRCLRSLSNAYYDGNRVNLHIFVDHFRNDSLSGPLDVDQKLNESRSILDFVDGYSWKFGEKVTHYRTGNVGLQAQWLEAWWPASDHEFAFVVEDDLEVSPFYYRFLKGLIEHFYYNASNYHPSIYGASLQRPRFVPGKHGNKMHVHNGSRLFLYQLVGTWGQLLFPRPWKEFRLWYDTHKAKGMKPILEGMVTTRWYKRLGERIWTPWFIKFIHARGYFNIYTNLFHERAFSVSHRDAGVNYGKTAGPDSYLVDKKSLDFNLLEMLPLGSLKWYDFCFREVVPDSVVRSPDELGSVLHSMQKLGTIIIVSLYGASDTVTRNLLCHFERLNIENYILLGPTSNFLLDLARRGHPVIDADQFFYSSRAYRTLRIQESSVEQIKDSLVKAYVIKKSLDVEYNIWLLDGNMLPFIPNSFLDSFEPTVNFHLAKSFNLLFVRSSSYAKRIWVDEFINKVAKMEITTRSVSMDLSCFIDAVEKLLEQNGLTFNKVDPMVFGLDISSIDANQASLGSGQKFAFWPSGMGLDIVQRRLEELGIWVVDADSSCTTVTCHPSHH